jgi:hydroxyacid-oxoacid transhydrogenase
MSRDELSDLRQQQEVQTLRVPSRPSYRAAYPLNANPLIVDGVSVAVTAPTVFKFTAPADPARHLAAAAVFGKDISRARDQDAGEILSDAIREFLINLGDQPRGIKDLGYERKDIPSLVEGTLPQRRVLDLAPHPVARDDLERLFEDALSY